MAARPDQRLTATRSTTAPRSTTGVSTTGVKALHPFDYRRQLALGRIGIGQREQNPSQRCVDPGPQDPWAALELLLQEPAPRLARRTPDTFTVHLDACPGSGNPIVG